ncbi:type IV pilin protein [Variovorax sp. E3]|uniref:type IV pilin protein n=1 Tax=Variovorax sp. E3 TaxID=1914993 RepID=UPI0018DB9BE6|nr:type IV pilin protein [Variovorax sp. E3]
MKKIQRSNNAASPRAGAGFTLIEVMIVVAIVAILAAIAYPAYTKQVQKSRRTDAKTALLDLVTREERYFTMNNAYTSTPANLGYGGTFPLNVLTSGTAFYQLNVTASSATGFTATATPVNAQANDTLCGTYTIDQLGTQTVSGSQAPADCW